MKLPNKECNEDEEISEFLKNLAILKLCKH